MEQDSPLDLNLFLNFDLASSSQVLDHNLQDNDFDPFAIERGSSTPDAFIPVSSSLSSDLPSGPPVSSAPADTSSTGLINIDHLPINVPSFWRPSIPCDYCMSRQLNCIFTVENQNCCSACTSLFRPCSFTHPQARAAHGYLDTLSSVAEDTEQLTGDLTSTKPLFSLGASMNDILDNIMKTQPERSTTRFPRSTTLILKKWLDAHCDNPYPTEEEKDQLKEQTGLSRNQISNWLANARRRGKVKPRRCLSPTLATGDSSSDPINIPKATPGSSSSSSSSSSSDNYSQSHLTPFERWKASPPENEPAPIAAITRAAATTKYNAEASSSSSQSHSLVDQHRSSTSAGSLLQAQSISSMDTGRSSGSLASTNGSAYSYGSRSSYNSFAGRDRRRRRRTVPKASRRSSTGPTAPKIFQCTFCTDTFHIKYDWSRHEKSLHLSLEKWLCAPLGPKVTSSADGSIRCVYCQLLNPPPEHFDIHNHSECEDKGRAARTFFRKDHLRQHLRLIHGVSLSPEMEAWKSAPEVIRSRCGFCPPENPTTFTTWQDRADHLADHFRRGTQMSQWKGDWGFDPEIAAQVTNAMPPWLIGHEYTTPNPYTASGAAVRSTPSNIELDEPPRISGYQLPGRSTDGKINTCWEILTVMLGRFVREQSEAGLEITDRDLQRQARIILYGDDDEWNQTAADNAEWLKLFRQAHGIGSDASDAGGSHNASASVLPQAGVLPSPLSPAFAMDPADGSSYIGLELDDTAFGQIFADAGLFSMDMGDLPLSAAMPGQFSASAPAAPSYLSTGHWLLPDAPLMGSVDDNDDERLGCGYEGQPPQ